MCAYNGHSVTVVKLLTLTLSWIIIIVSFNDIGLTVLVVNCRPTRLYVRGIWWRNDPLPPLDHLENYQEIPEKWLTFWFSFGVKKTRGFSASGGLRPLTPDQVLCPWTPLAAPPPDPRYKLAPPALAIRPLLCLIPRSAPDSYAYIVDAQPFPRLAGFSLVHSEFFRRYRYKIWSRRIMMNFSLGRGVWLGTAD